MSTKEALIELIRDLPDDMPAADMAYELYVRTKIDAGLRQAEAGEGISNEEFKKRMARWLVPCDDDVSPDAIAGQRGHDVA
jgi:hypothetical protein